MMLAGLNFFVIAQPLLEEPRLMGWHMSNPHKPAELSVLMLQSSSFTVSDPRRAGRLPLSGRSDRSSLQLSSPHRLTTVKAKESGLMHITSLQLSLPSGLHRFNVTLSLAFSIDGKCHVILSSASLCSTSCKLATRRYIRSTIDG